MKTLVVGIGALGTIFSCLLKEQGHEVAGIDRAPVVESIRKQGVRVTGIWGDHSAMLDEVAEGVEPFRGRGFDLIILTVKSFDTGAATAQIADLVGSGTRVVLAQNGYGNYEAAAKNIPEDRLILGRVIFGAETVGPGSSRVTVIADDVVLGSPRSLVDYREVEEIARVFNDAAIPTRASDQVMKYVWGKIIYNSALNSLGAILEVNYGKLAEIEYSRSIMDGIIGEIFDVLAASGQETLWPDAPAYRQEFYGRLVPVTAAHHASMLQDIQRGRKTEIEALNGAVVELGSRLGVNTPVNRVVTELVKAKESLVIRQQ
ncbi:MAG: 2-dehydropantoate 2-reductase [Firmicutes bacterium]|nr:2-dehydropantoate 2-reductase [Bacillota bacterium]